MRFVPAVLLLPLLLSCSPVPRPDDACTVAVRFADAWLREGGGHPIVFSDEPEMNLPAPGRGPWQDLGDGAKQGTPPSPAMREAAAKLNTASAVAHCPSLRAYLDRAHIAYGKGAVKDAIAESPTEYSYGVDILGLTLPNVSPDGTEALVATSGVSGPEAGSGHLLLLRRQPDGSWRAVSTQPLWTS